MGNLWKIVVDPNALGPAIIQTVHVPHTSKIRLRVHTVCIPLHTNLNGDQNDDCQLDQEFPRKPSFLRVLPLLEGIHEVEVDLLLHVRYLYVLRGV